MNEQPTITAACLAEIQTLVGAYVITHEYVVSGAANHIFRVCLPGTSIIAKVSKAGQPDLFACEADALQFMAAKSTVRTPIVIGHSADVLWLEDLGQEHKDLSDEQWSAFGRQIGGMHRVLGERFGYSLNNYIGIWRQINTYSSDWVDFYFSNRVLCYMDSGFCKTILTKSDRDAIEKLANKAHGILPPQAPSLCHGDFWISNIFRRSDGSVYVIDPDVTRHSGSIRMIIRTTACSGRGRPAPLMRVVAVRK